MLEIPGIRPEIIDALRERARDVLLTRAIAAEERFNDPYPAEDLLQMDGMDEELAVLRWRAAAYRDDGRFG
jgi:N utilization substance protein A